MNKHINTYCKGLTLVSERDISKKGFVQMLLNMQERFNDHYKTNDYSFNPERISEGGIVFNNFNNKEKYKTMRLYFLDKQHGNCVKSLYGRITDDTKDEWKENNEILVGKNLYLGTFLKSFRDAPKWTNDELKIFIQCFNDAGLTIYKIPTKRELKILDNSKYYLDLFNL